MREFLLWRKKGKHPALAFARLPEEWIGRQEDLKYRKTGVDVGGLLTLENQTGIACGWWGRSGGKTWVSDCFIFVLSRVAD